MHIQSAKVQKRVSTICLDFIWIGKGFLSKVIPKKGIAEQRLKAFQRMWVWLSPNFKVIWNKLQNILIFWVAFWTNSQAFQLIFICIPKRKKYSTKTVAIRLFANLENWNWKMQDIADMQFSSGEMHLQTSKVRQRVSTIEILSE